MSFSSILNHSARVLPVRNPAYFCTLECSIYEDKYHMHLLFHWLLWHLMITLHFYGRT